ncbi:hypothetical protein [Streptomyces sp. NPDC000229]|uniref:hypothetical protein n=1 Tax=Streptomyces sp. NPDC000229 TaxID=3154247 RepID=UPI0033254BE2
MEDEHRCRGATRHLLQFPAPHRTAAPAYFVVVWGLVSDYDYPGLVAAAAVAVLLIGVLALTVAEMWQAASSWQISMDLAPERDRAQYLSTFNLGTTAERVIGPAILPALVMTFRSWGWLVVSAVVLVSGVLTWWLTRSPDAAALREAPAEEPGKQVAGGPGTA